MDVPTVSEQHFLNYCKARGYTAKRINPQQNAGRFPDYETITPAGLVIVEIKEFTPNAQDRALAETFEKHGEVRFENHWVGKRVYGAIMDAAEQLRSYKETSLPEVILLYDNAVTAANRGFNDYLDPVHGIGAGMFGKPVIRFWPDPARKPEGEPDATHGGKRQLTATTGLHIGAVAVMKVNSNGEVTIDFFHNWFSTKRLWPRYFQHPDDRHYVKPDHPDKAEWAWDEFVGDRGST